MASPRIEQKFGSASSAWLYPASPLFRALNQQVPQQSDPPFGIVAYTYRAYLSKFPARLDLIHKGVMGTSYFIYKVTGDELRIGVGNDKPVAGNRPDSFGPKHRNHKQVRAEPAPDTAP